MVNITDFILNGYNEQLKIDSYLDISKVKLLATNATQFANGIPVGRQIEINNVVFDIGNDDNEILVYMIIKMNNQTEDLILNYNNNRIVLSSIELSEFIKVLDNCKIKWFFSRVFDKLIYMMIPQSNVEICFGFYSANENNEAEWGLQVIEVCNFGRMEEVYKHL
jgi:hypothetical protein